MRSTCLAFLMLVTACDEGESDRIELRSAILLEDGHTAILGLSHRGSAPGGSDSAQHVGAFHRAVLARHDLVSKDTQQLEVVDLGVGRDADAFQVQQTRGSFVLLFAPYVDRLGGGYALLDVRSGSLERVEVESELRSKGMAWIGTPHLVNEDGWLICGGLPPQGDAGSTAQDWWVRGVHGAWTLVYAGSHNVFWGDEEIYVDDTVLVTDPSWLAYRPSDGRRRRVHGEEVDAIGTGHPVGRVRTEPNRDLSNKPDKLLSVRVDPSDPARVPYLIMEERRGDELVETRVELDLVSLAK